MKVRFFVAVALVSVLCTFLAVDVFAAAHFWRQKVTDSRFVVMASNVKDAYGLTLEITYDPKALEKPVVTWGVFAQGEMSEMNIDTPGRISLVLAGQNALPTGGEVATISFTPKGNVSGQDITVKPLLIAQGGTRLGASPLDPTLSDKKKEGGGDGTPNPDTTPSAQGGSTTSISSLNVKDFNESLGTSSGSRTPGRIERRGGAEYESPAGQPSSGGRGESVGSVRGEARPEQKGPEKFVPNKSVLERFKDFTGERTAAALLALLAPATPTGFTQTPAIAKADGTSTLTVVLAGDPAAKDDPNFSLIKVRLVSLKRNEDGGWTIEAKPAKGAVAAVVAVSRSNVVTEYPLTVVPPAEVKTDMSTPGVTEADFILFLKEKGTDKEPRFDMNGDGKRDYVDDYIYAANFFLVTGGLKPQAPGTKPQEKTLKVPEQASKSIEQGAKSQEPSPLKAREEGRGKLPEQPRADAPDHKPVKVSEPPAAEIPEPTPVEMPVPTPEETPIEPP